MSTTIATNTSLPSREQGALSAFATSATSIMDERTEIAATLIGIASLASTPRLPLPLPQQDASMIASTNAEPSPTLALGTNGMHGVSGFGSGGGGTISSSDQSSSEEDEYPRGDDTGMLTANNADTNAHANQSTTSGTETTSATTAATAASATSDDTVTAVGVGVDANVTAAAVKAVRDAMERGQLYETNQSQLSQTKSSSSLPRRKIQIQLGVPLMVDTVGIKQQLLLPPGMELVDPIPIQMGGMVVPSFTNNQGKNNNSMSGSRDVLVVVACISVQTKKERHHYPATAVAAASPSVTGTTSSSSLQQASPTQGVRANIIHTRSHGMSAAATAAAVEPACPQFSQTTSTSSKSAAQRPLILPMPIQVPHGFGSSIRSSSDGSPESGGSSTSAVPMAKRNSNSMEMLASISAVMMAQHEQEQRDSSHNNASAASYVLDSAAAAAAAAAMFRRASMDSYLSASSASANGDGTTTTTTALPMADMRYGFKKLPPGKTSKNNKRLFVRHSYRDYSHEGALPEDQGAVATAAAIATGSLTLTTQPAAIPARTPNAAFPLKLHEILSQIERDGQENIIGWLPHGRSFQIFKQEEFVSMILPKYFVMTKRSSFLRQLNLYGFNRLSGGSYYHEKFLRGLKVLSSRMQRIKVNGNGIRAAGNPEEEPNLSSFPVCPPRILAIQAPPAPPTGVQPVTINKTVQPSPQAAAPSAVVRPSLSSPLTAAAPVTTAGLVTPRQLADASQRTTVACAAGVVSMDVVERRNSSGSTGSNSTCSSDSANARVNSAGSVCGSGSTTSTLVPARNDTMATSSANTIVSSLGTAPARVPLPAPAVIRGKTVLYQLETFPLKLQRILDKFESEGRTDVLSWLPHGRAFIVRDVDRFVNEVLPLHFNQSKYSSFQRQCHMYNFVRLTQAGPDKGGYYHLNLQRGKPDLIRAMQRTRVNGRRTRRPANPDDEPDFRLLPPLPGIVSGTRIDVPHDSTVEAKNK